MLRKKHGFSLLELMLVIAVMGVITLTGLSYIREKAFNTKIDKTALQMQQWLQAGTSYYVDNNEWPTRNEQLMPPNPGPSDHVYLTLGSQISPWGNETQYTYSIAQSQTSTLDRFYVSLELPATIGSLTAEEVARRIAAKLPSAQWDVATNRLTADIGKPTGPGGGGGNMQIKGIYIRKVGDASQAGYISCDNNPAYSKKIPKPDCGGTGKGESAFVPKLYLSIQSLKFPMRITTKGDESGYSPNVAHLTFRDDPNDSKAWQAAITIKGVSYQDNPCSYTGTIMAITACVKQNYDPEE